MSVKDKGAETIDRIPSTLSVKKDKNLKNSLLEDPDTINMGLKANHLC